MTIMTNREFVDRLHKAVNTKTLYVWGCFGGPMIEKNKKRYTTNHSYNMQSSRKTMIERASSDTFGFDCVCLIKGILWGWDADPDKTYGGARYESNGIPDTTITTLLNKYCTDQSNDFSNIEVGEFLVMDGHCGVYIGDGLAIECTPKWTNNVQITEVWNIRKTSSVGRTWEKHGKFTCIEYLKEPKAEREVICVLPDDAPDGDIEAICKALTTAGFIPSIYTKRR